jgi:hypothetical protein
MKKVSGPQVVRTAEVSELPLPAEIQEALGDGRLSRRDPREPGGAIPPGHPTPTASWERDRDGPAIADSSSTERTRQLWRELSGKRSSGQMPVSRRARRPRGWVLSRDSDRVAGA